MRRASIEALVAAALALLVSAASTIVHAQEPEASKEATNATPPILVVKDEDSGEIVDRVRAELTILGFTALVIPAAGNTRDPAALEAAARDGRAAAAIRVVRTPSGAEVWIVDRVTGKTLRRAVDADDPATIAVRVVELLRASLLEIRAAHPSRGEVAPDATAVAVTDASLAPPPPPPSPSPSPQPPPRERERERERGRESGAAPTGPAEAQRVGLGLGVAPAMLWSAGGLPASGMLDVSAHVMPWEHVGIGAFVQIPLASVERQGAEGTRRSTVALAALGARFVPVDAEARWQPVVGTGLGAAWLRVTGEPSSNLYVGSEHDAFAVVPYLRAGLSVRIVGPLRVATHALGGVALPRIVIDAAGREADRWGHPVVGLAAGLEVATP